MLAKPLCVSAFLLSCLAALSFTTAARAQEESESSKGSKATGFALQTSVGTSTTVIDEAPVLIGLGSFTGGLTLGYKFNRVMIGIGFDFTNFSETRTEEQFDPMTGQVTGSEDVTRSSYTFVVYPEVQVAIAQSSDKRAELIGNFSVGIGTWGTRRTPEVDPDPTLPTPNEDTDILVRWRIGPGVRYWVHPQIGVSLTTGITGNHMITLGNTPARDESSSVAALHAQFGLLGVF